MSFIDALFVYFVLPVLNVFLLVLIISIILSWLISFQIVNPYNPVVGSLWRVTNMITEPVLRPIRSILPPLGGLDFSALVAILLVQFISGWVIPEIMIRF